MRLSRRTSAAYSGRVHADLAEIRRSLLAWYDRGHRRFPWRQTADPYAVLVSEVMLQQTQASRVVDRFPRFMARFPDTAALAAADPADVLAEWSGLGYNRRALALRDAAAVVMRDGWPESVERLERLPGIGPYTARAIASLAFGSAVGPVDTNVRRWLVRRLSLDPADRGAIQRMADDLATADGGARAAAWTHATMEFGARVCRSSKPPCGDCPLAVGCPARGAGASVPVPAQPAFRGSWRAYRGALLHALVASRDRRMSLAAARRKLAGRAAAIGPALDASAFDRLVRSLERDRLVARSGDRLQLGAPPRPLPGPAGIESSP